MSLNWDWAWVSFDATLNVFLLFGDLSCYGILVVGLDVLDLG